MRKTSAEVIGLFLC